MPEPMASGGKWLAISQDAVPVYAVGEDTINRLLLGGWVEVPDPREEVAETPTEEANEVPAQVEAPKALESPIGEAPVPEALPAESEGESGA